MDVIPPVEEYDVSGFRYVGRVPAPDAIEKVNPDGSKTITADLFAYAVQLVVRSCPQCRALVMDVDTTTHDAWHDELADQVRRGEA